jgi:hypothetical protein
LSITNQDNSLFIWRRIYIQQVLSLSRSSDWLAPPKLTSSKRVNFRVEATDVPTLLVAVAVADGVVVVVVVVIVIGVSVVVAVASDDVDSPDDVVDAAVAVAVAVAGDDAGPPNDTNGSAAPSVADELYKDILVLSNNETHFDPAYLDDFARLCAARPPPTPPPIPPARMTTKTTRTIQNVFTGNPSIFSDLDLFACDVSV